MLPPNAQFRKARRASKSIVGGDALWSALNDTSTIALMVEAIAEEVPPVSKISETLMETVGDEVALKALPVRQFIGMAVKAILAKEGYEVMETGVKIADDPIFRSGATYQRVEEPEDDTDDLLSRLVNAMNPDELHRLDKLVQAAL